MKRWFTLFAVMIVALGSVMLAGCTPQEEGGEAEGGETAEPEASLSTDTGDAVGAEAATTEGS